MKNIPLGVLLLALLFPIFGHAQARGTTRNVRHTNRQTKSPTVRKVPSAHALTPKERPAALEGISTWYGPEMQIKPGVYHRMANGQPFDPKKLTAASLTLPLGTMVRVTNLRTGLSVDVEITDRGPFTKGRILDLAEEAANRIRCRGVCRVRLEPIKEG